MMTDIMADSLTRIRNAANRKLDVTTLLHSNRNNFVQHTLYEVIRVKNEVISFDAENGILVLKGSIPGANGARGLVRIVK